MTQAIALRQILTKAGHEVPEVLLGRHERRQVPAFFTTRIGCRITMFSSPNFVVDANRRGILVWSTIWRNFLRIHRYLNSLHTIRNAFRRIRPDVVINFYDALAGLSFFLFRPCDRFYCLGHQYLLNHPRFPMLDEMVIDRLLLQLNTWWTALGAREHLALSFLPMENHLSLKIRVVPPLLREEIFQLRPETGLHFLAYMVNDGYAEDIIEQHAQQPDLQIEAFWDRKTEENPLQIRPGLRFHQLDDAKFLETMRTCQGYLTTAGFESICEAMYLGKPVLMVPTAGHVEQRCNALDASLAGAGIQSDRFDLPKFLQFIPEYRQVQNGFSTWVRQAPQAFLQALEEPV